MKKFIVITTIFSPTEAVKKFAGIKDWQLIVVGDRRTPRDWKLNNVIYLSCDEQLKLFPKLAKNLPWDSYSRKNLGYLYAIKAGADIIVDTDDDNIPYDDWGKNISFEDKFNTVKSSRFVNIYKYFTDEFIWPRGYPINKLFEKKKEEIKSRRVKVGIWQFLADNDPDVDSIYRLTINKRVFFAKNPPVVLKKNTVCPINTQNTFFRKEVFPLLFLPPYINIRCIDIIKGLVAQPLLWQLGFHVGFGQASVIQKRNPHDYLKDFELEIPIYLNSENIFLTASNAINKNKSLADNMINVYKHLNNEDIVPKKTLVALNTWLDENNFKSYK